MQTSLLIIVCGTSWTRKIRSKRATFPFRLPILWAIELRHRKLDPTVRGGIRPSLDSAEPARWGFRQQDQQSASLIVQSFCYTEQCLSWDLLAACSSQEHLPPSFYLGGVAGRRAVRAPVRFRVVALCCLNGGPTT